MIIQFPHLRYMALERAIKTSSRPRCNHHQAPDPEHFSTLSNISHLAVKIYQLMIYCHRSFFLLSFLSLVHIPVCFFHARAAHFLPLDKSVRCDKMWNRYEMKCRVSRRETDDKVFKLWKKNGNLDIFIFDSSPSFCFSPISWYAKVNNFSVHSQSQQASSSNS